MIRKSIIGIAILCGFASCNHDKRIIVEKSFVDSLINNYKQPEVQRINESEIKFWGDRINPNNPGFTNEVRYAGALATRFSLLGDINDIKSSDRVLLQVDSVYNHKEPGPNMAMALHAITQHQFNKADSLLNVAKNIGIKKYDSYATSFDVDFELGRYDLASNDLKNIRSNTDYGYLFRLSKLLHYKSNIDSSIAAMLSAAKYAGTIVAIKQPALSNAADLSIHAGRLQQAYDLYVSSVRLSAADLHSILGIGWIALVHDKNDSLAEKIFQFVQSKTKLPDPLFKLMQVAEFRNDSIPEKKYADEFVSMVTDSLHGNMYNKYLIELYTGILNEPAKAESLARKELQNRATPQTYAWYVWSLFANNKKEEAYNNYEKFVSGKPLEGLELYWMGKLMQGLNKGYNAQQFFKAAEKNRYDLSPDKVKDLEKDLEE